MLLAAFTLLGNENMELYRESFPYNLMLRLSAQDQPLGANSMK